MSDTMVTLISKDNDRFTIEKELAIKSITIKNLVEPDSVLSAFIHLFDIDSKTLALVIKYLNIQDRNDQKKFVEDLKISTNIDLANAARFLEIKEMFDILCQNMADLIKGKSAEEIRIIFNIKNDFTPEEEEEEAQRENAWALA